MKKAKLMLTAMTVLTLVGGALAFKAKSFGPTSIFTGTLQATDCPFVNPHSKIVGGANNFIYTTNAANTQVSGACLVARIVPE